MHEITLRDLMIAWKDRPDAEPLLLESDFTLMIDGIGHLNAHIAFPTNPELLRQNCYERLQPLSWETPIYGDYLYLEYAGHDPSLRLHSLENLTQAKDAVLSPAGFLNIWKDDMMVVEYGKRRDFVIHYTDRHGDAKVFSKRSCEPVLETDKIGTIYYDQVRLEWV